MIARSTRRSCTSCSYKSTALCQVNLFPKLGIPDPHMLTRTIQLTAVVVSLLLTSCATGRSTQYSMRVQVAEDANVRTPVPVDLVFVWDKAIAGQLAATTAKDWFASKKTEFRQDDPGARKITVCEWEWVPGQNVADINLAVPVAARRWSHGVFVFADYRSPGAHRSKVTPGSEALLELGRDDLTVRPGGRTSAREYQWLDDTCTSTRSGLQSSR